MDEMHAPNIQIKYIEDEQTVQIHQTREHEGKHINESNAKPNRFRIQDVILEIEKNTHVYWKLAEEWYTQTK